MKDVAFICFSEFLAEGCLSEINVSAEIKKECVQDMKTPSRYAFSSAKVSFTFEDIDLVYN